MSIGERAAAVIAIAVIALAAIWFAFEAGRAAEAQLTLDALDRAEYATALLRDYLPEAERAAAVCTTVHASLHDLLGHTPIEPVWTTRLLVSAP